MSLCYLVNCIVNCVFKNLQQGHPLLIQIFRPVQTIYPPFLAIVLIFQALFIWLLEKNNLRMAN